MASIFCNHPCPTTPTMHLYISAHTNKAYMNITKHTMYSSQEVHYMYIVHTMCGKWVIAGGL